MATLQVTQTDINEARARRTLSTIDRPRSGYRHEQDCPIGVALARTFGVPREDVRVDPDSIHYTFGEPRHVPIVDSNGRKCGTSYERGGFTFEVTQIMRDFMRSWDRRGRAEPHNFKLTLR